MGGFSECFAGFRDGFFGGFSVVFVCFVLEKETERRWASRAKSFGVEILIGFRSRSHLKTP